jgi:DNA-binding transcriptional ArsR family regulator
MRRRILRERGLAALVRTLAPELGATGASGCFTIHCPGSANELRFDGPGSLLLTPSFFCWPHLEAFGQKTPHGARARITYPIPTLPMRTRPSIDGKLVVEATRAIADPARFRIIELLRARDLSTRELAGFLRLGEPVVSKHLRKLSRAGLVSGQRSSYFVIYRLQRDMLARLSAVLSSL